MRILSEAWRGVICCPACDRVLEIEEKDLKHTDRCHFSYGVKCCGCQTFFRIELIDKSVGASAMQRVPAGWFPKKLRPRG